jgi:hypothetical protein
VGEILEKCSERGSSVPVCEVMVLCMEDMVRGSSVPVLC